MSRRSKSVSDQGESSTLRISVVILPPRIRVIFRTGVPFYAECCVNTMISNVQALDVEGPGDGIAYPPDACRRPMDVTQGLVKWLPTVPGVEYLRIEPYPGSGSRQLSSGARSAALSLKASATWSTACARTKFSSPNFS